MGTLQAGQWLDMAHVAHYDGIETPSKTKEPIVASPRVPCLP